MYIQSSSSEKRENKMMMMNKLYSVELMKYHKEIQGFCYYWYLKICVLEDDIMYQNHNDTIIAFCSAIVVELYI